MLLVRAAFLERGYDRLTMVDLAQACRFSRRALYHYFDSKESAFRSMIRHFNTEAIKAGLEAGRSAQRCGGDSLEILASTLDARYGDTRRILNLSPYIIDLNAEAFRRCRDIMIEAAIAFREELENLIQELVSDGLMTLRPGYAPGELAQILTDGARGVNQSLPPIASKDYAGRYRQMVAVILFGSSVSGAGEAQGSVLDAEHRPSVHRARG